MSHFLEHPGFADDPASRSGIDDGLPLLWDTSAEPPVFAPDDWFKFLERTGGVPRPALPLSMLVTVAPGIWKAALSLADADVHPFATAAHPFAVGRVWGMPVALGFTQKGSASAGALEEYIALGARRFVFVGGCGAIVPDLPIGAAVVAHRALRDEGLSFAYLPPGRYVDATVPLVDALAKASSALLPEVRRGAIWTTFAHFRQNAVRMAAFAAEGCVAVNNETAAMYAVAAYHGVEIAALHLVGDTLARGAFEIDLTAPDHLGAFDDLAVVCAALEALLA
ncbi:uridine phosphorylase [Microbacterium sp. SLBN-154]|uniref:phosphorylase family protein n=1 Tax=Microbacterium sp. SLBN-154 TaxID=2768458 RepID=UPI00114F7A48|nr:nucleoside phosphorylase [Microbacterium sp. SLBN-154]TQK17661.1 uridine phosphorylase [Microbacterium sp. SLBN-154]